jgi:hypothetical protein
VYNNVETSKGEASSQGFVRDGQCDYLKVLSRYPYEVNAEKYEISSRSWLRASSMLKLNKNQPDAHRF